MLLSIRKLQSKYAPGNLFFSFKTTGIFPKFTIFTTRLIRKKR